MQRPCASGITRQLAETYSASFEEEADGQEQQNEQQNEQEQSELEEHQHHHQPPALAQSPSAATLRQFTATEHGDLRGQLATESSWSRSTSAPVSIWRLLHFSCRGSARKAVEAEQRSLWATKREACAQDAKTWRHVLKNGGGGLVVVVSRTRPASDLSVDSRLPGTPNLSGQPHLPGNPAGNHSTRLPAALGCTSCLRPALT